MGASRCRLCFLQPLALTGGRLLTTDKAFTPWTGRILVLDDLRSRLDPCDSVVIDCSYPPATYLEGRMKNWRFCGGSKIYILRITSVGYTWLGYYKIGIKIPRVLIPSANLPCYCGRSYCTIAVYFGLMIFGVISQNDDEKDTHKKRRVRAVAWAP